MDAIKVAKIEGVSCRGAGQNSQGTLHLTAHHLIFHHDITQEEEMWIPYPLISLVTRLPITLEGHSPLSIHSRNFRSFTLTFKRDSESSDVFDSIRGLTVASSVAQLYAFFYTPNPPFASNNGWSLYSPREEFARMGVGSRTRAWRFTDINKDYSFCTTYPARLVVPTRISDTTLQYASKYRSKCRIPALAYLHWANYGTITRSSQPMVGITNNRSIQDEKLIEAIFQSHHSPESRAAAVPVYGATATNLIIDARPTANAMANVAKGAGTENMDHYKEGRKAYLGVDNIHVMRDSLNKVVEALREADSLAFSVGGDESGRLSSLSSALLDRQALRRSGWLRHLSAIMDGTLLIIRNVHVNSSHVLIHCSDGWDRTAQLSSLAQLCLDPFYRTVKGFQILIEKDWLSFGHRFLDRCGHLSSDKFFLSATDASTGGSAEATQAAQAFLASVQNKLSGQGHLKETSPVFHQFLECVRQIQRQFPDRFEFNGRFLERIHYHLYSCQFGTFLFNNERERRLAENGPSHCERTVSVWDFLNSPPEVEKNLNPSYDPTLDNPTRRDPKADMGVLLPNPKDVRFWNELYGRTDEEMNGKVVAVEAQGTDIIGPVEGTEDDPISSATSAEASDITVALSMPLPTSPPPLSLSPGPLRAASITHLGDSRRKDRIAAVASTPTLSSSMPELTQKPPAPTRQDSFRPFGTTSSSFTLRSKSPSLLSDDTDDQASPRARLGLPPADVLQGGMKSMWGKLSYNASAAFTAVQGAYDGVSKEFKGMGITQGWDNQRGSSGELQSRGRPPKLDDEPDWTTPSTSTEGRVSSFTPSFSSDGALPSDRWKTEGSSSKLSALTLDNPWGTQKHQGGRSSPRRAEDVFSTSSVWANESRQLSSSLPLDPSAPSARSISQPVSNSPTPMSRVASFSNYSPGDARGSLPKVLTDEDHTPSLASTARPSSADINTDPLGAGVL